MFQTQASPLALAAAAGSRSPLAGVLGLQLQLEPPAAAAAACRR